MKKILLFTGLLFFFLSANIKAQTISNVTVSDSILCNGELGELTIDILQSTPPTNPLEIVVGSFATWNASFFLKTTSASVLSITTLPIPNLPAGTYTIMLVDPVAFYATNPSGNGFLDPNDIYDTWSVQVTFTEPDSLLATTFPLVDNLCFGDCEAEEQLFIQGGTIPYSFSINGGVTQTITTGTGNTQDFVNLCAGDYNIVVTDDNDCPTLNPPSQSPHPDTTYFTITEPSVIIPNGLVTSDYNGVNVSCNGFSNGQITASASGGTGTIQYSIDGITFSFDSVFSGLSAGSHTITYRDDNNCDTSETFTLTEPSPFSVSLTETQSVSCFSICDGEITVTPSGGTANFQYSLDNGVSFQGVPVFSSLCGDSVYDLLAIDENGCSANSSLFLSSPTEIIFGTLISDYNGYEISCNGANDGQISILLPSGGTPPFQYSNDSGNTYVANNVFSNLSADQYNLSVIDFNGCTSDIVVENLIEPGPFTLTANITSGIDCPGACTGSVSVTGLNGVAAPGFPLYTLSGGVSQTTDFWNNLCGDLSYGLYDITAIDANNCTATTSFSIPEPSPFDYTTSSIDETCSQSNGQASINYISGGTGSWSYQWNDLLAQTTSTAFNLTTGTYQVTVTDGNSCQFTEDVQVSFDIGFTLSFDSISPCAGGSQGSAIVYATGTPPFTYLWSNGDTTQTASNLSVGVYTVDVTDATNCTISGSVEIIPTTNALAIDSLIISPITCHNANNASIQILATGGQQFNPDGIPNNGDEYYLYSNDNGLTDQTSIGFANLSSGSYTMHVRDAGNCIDTQTVVIVNPDQIEIDSTIFTDVSCYALDDGAIQAINASGGTPPFEYSVNGGVHYTNMAYFNNYSPGSYTVEVYDIYNCTAQDIIIIDEPDELDVTITTSLWNSYEVKCHGESSGFANIVVLGGTTPYTRNCYDNTGALVATSMNPLITGLSAGAYTFEIIDANGCAYYETITYNEPSPIVHNFIPTHVTCSGWSNGSLIDAVSGGVGSATTYIYSWNTGDSTYSLTGIPIGTYTMTVRDENNCFSTDSYTINDNNVLSATTIINDVSCYDYCDGIITANVTGGIPNYDINGNPVYTYQWNDILAQTTQSAIGLCADNLTNTTMYTCVINDSQGCSDTVEAVINQPLELEVSASILNEISCYLGDDGRVTASVIGGNGGNTYLWNNSSSWSSNPLNNNITVGSYTVIAQDMNGCMDTTEISLTQPDLLTLSVSETDINCFGESTGTITAEANGGTPIPGIPPEYNYAWSNSFNEQISISTAINLSPGIYTVTASDQNGCAITSETIYITEPSNPLTISLDSIDETCEVNDGGANSFVLGGTLPYNYLWSNGANSSSIGNLSPGTYSVEVTDANGCIITGSTYVNGVTNIFLPGNLSSIDTSICLGESIFIDIEEKPTLTYEWEDGPFVGYMQADRLFTPTQGINIYNLIITDPDCPPYSVEVIISVDAVDPKLSADNETFQYSVPTVIFPEITTAIKTVVIGMNNALQLSSENNNCDLYNWSWDNNLNSANQYIDINSATSNDQGWYYLSVDSAGCVGFDSIYVMIAEEGGIKPYDAFTPNGDNDNETWDIVSIELYPEAKVQIFNRWGALIFETSGGEQYIPWDGTYNGEDLPIGTYYYIIDLNNNATPISGPVTIIR